MNLKKCLFIFRTVLHCPRKLPTPFILTNCPNSQRIDLFSLVIYSILTENSSDQTWLRVNSSFIQKWGRSLNAVFLNQPILDDSLNWLKGTSDPSHFIFKITVEKCRIRHTMFKLDEQFLDRLRVILCSIRLFSTLILKIKWLGSELLLIEVVAYCSIRKHRW